MGTTRASKLVDGELVKLGQGHAGDLEGAQDAEHSEELDAEVHVQMMALLSCWRIRSSVGWK
jgi:hypothetical protein